MVEELNSGLPTVADPDLELRGCVVLIYLPYWLFSLLSFLLFLPQIMRVPSPRSATDLVKGVKVFFTKYQGSDSFPVHRPGIHNLASVKNIISNLVANST